MIRAAELTLRQYNKISPVFAFSALYKINELIGLPMAGKIEKRLHAAIGHLMLEAISLGAAN
jgi:hypothetical protein